jgi:hypothetical protein
MFRRTVLTFIGLVLLMIATRFPGLASNWHLQDASWALFFIAGFYLSRHWRWAFPALMVVAVAIDLVAIRFYGIDNYCMTVAYWFVVPGYGALWFGGHWLSRRASLDGRGLILLAASLALSVSVCYLITNGSFYWLSDRAANPSWEGWARNFAAWYWPFTRVTLAYVAVATFVHVLIAKLPGRAIQVRA